jgi:hypothetical protein
MMNEISPFLKKTNTIVCYTIQALDGSDIEYDYYGESDMDIGDTETGSITHSEVSLCFILVC